jgi:aryl-alcohol dehydrogenase-like predicted oxidoreductase/AcrR family transcriptional regulator
LLAQRPDHEPSTRELYEAAGVAAPTLYHHFGDKAGLLEAVAEEAFSAYLDRKRAVPRTGDLLADFATGWDLHIGFGVENPVLYGLMYRGADGRRSPAAQLAETQLRRGLERMAGAGLLRMPVDQAMALTTAMAIGCVTQLNHDRGSVTKPLAQSMRTALIAQLTGQSSPQNGKTMNSLSDRQFTVDHLIGGRDLVPRLGYGAMQLAGPGVIGLPEDLGGAIEVLRQAVDRGVRFFDTANAYGPRTVNQLIGRALSPYAEDIVIGNKVGAGRDGAGGWLIDSRPETVRGQVEDALLDLRADFSMLTYLRLPGDSQGRGNAGRAGGGVPLADSLGVLAELRDEGKIRHIGLSGASPAVLAQAQQITPIAAVQNRFNLVDRSGVEVLAACEREGIAFVPYWPLAYGLLGDLAPLTEPAERLGVPASTVALAWLLRRSPVMIPIPGTKSLAHLADNLRAPDVAARLTEDEVRTLAMVEDEESATLSQMSARMTEALRATSRPGR